MCLLPPLEGAFLIDLGFDVSFPEEYRAKITPRSQDAINLIKNASLSQM